MTNAQIVALGVRLFSIWVMLYLFAHTPGLWTFIDYGKSGGAGAGFVVAVSLVLALAAVGLWFFPLAVARKLLPTATLDQPTALPVEQAQRAGFCLLGLWVLAESVPDLVFYAVVFVSPAREGVPMPFDTDAYPRVAHSVAEFIIGVWLVLGARGLLGILRWARTVGLAEPSNSAVQSDGRQETPAASNRER